MAKMAGTEQYMYHGAFSGYNEFSLTKVALVDEISTDAGSVKMYYSSVANCLTIPVAWNAEGTISPLLWCKVG